MSNHNQITYGKLLANIATSIRGLLVKNVAGKLTPTTGVTDVAIGVWPETARSADVAMNLVLSGVVKVRAQGAITIFAHVSPSAAVDGAVVASTSTDLVVGIALHAAADTEDVTIQLFDFKQNIEP